MFNPAGAGDDDVAAGDAAANRERMAAAATALTGCRARVGGQTLYLDDPLPGRDDDGGCDDAKRAVPLFGLPDASPSGGDGSSGGDGGGGGDRSSSSPPPPSQQPPLRQHDAGAAAPSGDGRRPRAPDRLPGSPAPRLKRRRRRRKKLFIIFKGKKTQPELYRFSSYFFHLLFLVSLFFCFLFHMDIEKKEPGADSPR